AVLAAVAARPGFGREAAGTSDEFLIALGPVSGPSGARLLARFCHTDPALRDRVEALLRDEEALRPDAVFAEVVHVPEHERTGNILSRPVLRGYEIAFHGHSGAPRTRQLPLSDLLVSVAGGEVRLRSARLGRRVIPRLSSAHNFGVQGHDVYRFLCEL